MHDATLTVRMENHPGVLARIAAIFHRRGINIVALRVAPTVADERISELVLRAEAPAPDLERLGLALTNLVDVYDVRLDVHGAARSRAPGSAPVGTGRL
jgi:acetolactate synthase-1/3 small subunit